MNLKILRSIYGKKRISPTFYDEKTLNNPFPDYCNTLFCKPDVIKNAQDEAVIEFYCSNINTKFMGIIEGVSSDVFLGTQNFKFLIRKRE